MILGLMLAVAATFQARAASVTLDWDAVTTNADGSPITDLSGYRVFYATYSLLGMTTAQAFSASSVIKAVPSTPSATTTTLTAAGLSDGTTYYFRVTAFDTSSNQSGFNVDNGGLDVEISTYTPPPPAPLPPTAPGSLALQVLSSSQIKLTWNDSSRETSYRVERSLDNVTFTTVTAAVAANAVTYTDTGLLSATLYYYRVVAKNAVGEAVSGTASATTQSPPATPPVQPSALHLISATTSQIKIGWTDNSSDETAFQLQWSLTGTGGWTAFPNLSPNTTFYVESGLPAGTTHYYQVRAINGVGNPSFTAAVAGQTLPASVGGLGGLGSVPPGLKECYAYPNPAVGRDLVVRAMMGGVDSVEITIFDQSGHAVKSDRMTQLISVNGQPAMEYLWTGEKASGIYYAVIHGKKGDQTIRARAKFAVVR
jgi:hypothetical protein